jgi:hypothetical protein
MLSNLISSNIILSYLVYKILIFLLLNQHFLGYLDRDQDPNMGCGSRGNQASSYYGTQIKDNVLRYLMVLKSQILSLTTVKKIIYNTPN